MKPKTDLDLWMHRNGYTSEKFAKALSRELGEKVPVSTVAKWRLGLMMPRPEKMVAIGNLTDGDVNMASFLAAAANLRTAKEAKE